MPRLLRFVVPPGREGEARREADRLAAALQPSDGHVFFAGSGLLLLVPDLDVLEDDKVAPAFHKTASWLVADLGRLEAAHDLPLLGAGGRPEGRAVLLAAPTGDPRRAVDAWSAAAEDDLPGVAGWQAFGRGGDLALVLRGDEGLAEAVQRLLRAPARELPVVRPQRSVPPRARTSSPLQDALLATTAYEPDLPSGLFPELAHAEDGIRLGTRLRPAVGAS